MQISLDRQDARHHDALIDEVCDFAILQQNCGIHATKIGTPEMPVLIHLEKVAPVMFTKFETFG